MKLEKIIKIIIYADYRRATSSGNEGKFQVSGLTGFDTDDKEYNLTKLIDSGDFYDTAEEVVKSIGLNNAKIEVEIESP